MSQGHSQTQNNIPALPEAFLTRADEHLVQLADGRLTDLVDQSVSHFVAKALCAALELQSTVCPESKLRQQSQLKKRLVRKRLQGLPRLQATNKTVLQEIGREIALETLALDLSLHLLSVVKKYRTITSNTLGKRT